MRTLLYEETTWSNAGHHDCVGWLRRLGPDRLHHAGGSDLWISTVLGYRPGHHGHNRLYGNVRSHRGGGQRTSIRRRPYTTGLSTRTGNPDRLESPQSDYLRC